MQHHRRSEVQEDDALLLLVAENVHSIVLGRCPLVSEEEEIALQCPPEVATSPWRLPWVMYL